MGNKVARPQLPKEDMDFLLRKTSMTSKEIKHWYKIYMKECPSGKLSKDQFCRIYAELTPSKRMHPLFEHIFRTYDQDNSGEIDFLEFIQAVNISRTTKPEEKLRMAFRLYDIDQSGTIEEKEMIEVMKDLYVYTNGIKVLGKEQLPESQALHNMNGEEIHCDFDQRIKQRTRRIFEEADKNHDGCVTFDELVNVCLRNPDIYNMIVCTSKPTHRRR